MRTSMTDVYRRMLNKDNDESPAKCRERRRRRIEMRRLAAMSVACSSLSEHLIESSDYVAEGKRIRTAEDANLLSSSASSGEETEAVSSPAAAQSESPENDRLKSVSVSVRSRDTEALPSPEAAPSENPENDRVPVFGLMSVSGRSREMEDAVAVRTSFFRALPVHFFAVYDGHGGSQVAALCRERMHMYLEEELMRVENTGQSASGDNTIQKDPQQQRRGVEDEEEWRRVLKRSFERMDELALSTCACGSVGYQCGCHPMELALSGSTAVVAVLTPDKIVVANCGDSRAVLCRSGMAIPLSLDHKNVLVLQEIAIQPDRSDELARIEATGGHVIFMDGPRVEGILAMSRAIGDKYLKPAVISEPEISFTNRDPEDECLILASDGLWDVLSSDLACKVASECLHELRPASATIDLNAGPRSENEGVGTLYPSRSALAAALLTRLALGRRSSDNISVIVVDLKRS